MKINLSKAKEVVKAKTTDQKLDKETGEIKKVNRGKVAKPTHFRFQGYTHKGNYEKLKAYALSQKDTYGEHLDIAIEDYLKKVGEL
jgi:phage I-like protein